VPERKWGGRPCLVLKSTKMEKQIFGDEKNDRENESGKIAEITA
jgi:hypothetical protein